MYNCLSVSLLTNIIGVLVKERLDKMKRSPRTHRKSNSFSAVPSSMLDSVATEKSIAPSISGKAYSSTLTKGKELSAVVVLLKSITHWHRYV